MTTRWRPGTFEQGSLRDDDDLCWSSLLDQYHDYVLVADEYAAAYAEEKAQFLRGFPEDYLYRSDMGRACIETSMAMVQLNDFCVLCLQQAATYLEGLRSDLDNLKGGKQRNLVAAEDSPWGIAEDFTGETIDMVQDAVWTWEDTNLFLVRAMVLIMLSAFLEKSLKSICLEIALAAEPQPKAKPGEGKTEGYLRYLRENCHLDFVEPAASIEQRERCRKLRNDFAHGDWEAVKQQVGNVRLRDVFGAVSGLLRVLQAAHEDQPSAGNAVGEASQGSLQP